MLGPSTLQVGMTVYTDYPTASSVSPFMHNSTVIHAGNPDLVAAFDYFRFAPTSNSHTNFVGFGARAAFNANRLAQLEAEMNYDFERNFTTINNNGGTTSFSTTRLRPLTDAVPKPLMPLCGVPLLRYNFALLKNAGVHEVVINTHHLGKAMERGAVEIARQLGASLTLSPGAGDVTVRARLCATRFSPP